MNPNRRTNKDANHDEIVAEFNRLGAWVHFIEKPADLLLAHNDRFTVVEIKRNHNHKKTKDTIANYQMTEAEITYYEHVKSRAPYIVIWDISQVGALLEACACLSRYQYLQYCAGQVSQWARAVYRDDKSIRRLTAQLQDVQKSALI